jgi:hypothetical protein
LKDDAVAALVVSDGTRWQYLNLAAEVPRQASPERSGGMKPLPPAATGFGLPRNLLDQLAASHATGALLGVPEKKTPNPKIFLCPRS